MCYFCSDLEDVREFGRIIVSRFYIFFEIVGFCCLGRKCGDGCFFLSWGIGGFGSGYSLGLYRYFILRRL